MQKNISKHLNKKEKIQLGSFYTPKVLVDKVSEYIQPYVKNNKTIIFDSSAGGGAFIDAIGKYDYRLADYDKEACNFLERNFDKNKIYYSNSLINVSRKKYNIPEDSFLIQVGNPPYNDTTSEFKSGQKGKNECDLDLFDRDLGVSFLKSYNKLNSDVICVLHPLSYLIKETNFNRLKTFRENYILKKAIIFPSSLFEGTGTIKFPIVIALYKKNDKGMNFDYIKNFEFSIMDSHDIFKLNNYTTIDKYINKYPPRSKDSKISSLNLYYYTIRDLNSLIKNTSFLSRIIPNGIVVELDTFYKYAYLYSLKSLFTPKNIWLYGNISPLCDIDMVEKNKNLFIQYTFLTNKIIDELPILIKQQIIKYYKLPQKMTEPVLVENEIKTLLNKLI